MGGHHRPLLGGCTVLLCLLLQAGKASGEESPCVPGFEAEKYTFAVDSTQLDPGTVLGKVAYSDCAGLSGVLYVNEDEFTVQPDGIVSVNRPIVLHGEQRSFSVNSWDESGKTFSTIITLRIEGHHHHHPHHHHHHPHHHRHHPHHHHHHHHKKNPSPVNHTENQVIFFPKAQQGLRRQKRDWVVPPMSVSENERGPFPKNLVPIKSNKDKETTVYYSLTGPGASEPPVGIFQIVRNTGVVQVTRPLDREQCAVYTVFSHAVSIDGVAVEDPMELIIKVTDQNDNKPEFIEKVFEGKVPEGSQPGTPVMSVNATDADDSVDTNNGIVHYKIIDQEPKVPNGEMFTMNKVTGLISVISTGLDRELVPKYVLIVEASDQEGVGFSTTGTAMIQVTDTNDNEPQFDPAVYTATVPENQVGFVCQKLTVIDLDVPNTQAWNAVYKIVKGNDGGSFNVTTDPTNNQGILTTVKGLDFETKKQYILLITAVNQIPFSVTLPTSTATVTVNVEDDNEAPIFVPQTKDAEARENLAKGMRITTYTAQDPDKMQNQKITYRIDEDPAGWLSVDPDNGIVTGNGNLDREAKDYLDKDVYRATILATDDGTPQLTGTGTLLIRLIDVNDNGPEPDPRTFQICIQNPQPQTLKIVDADIEPNTFPYTVELSHDSQENWTAEVSGKNLIIAPRRELERRSYTIAVTLGDSGEERKLTTITALACNCDNDKTDCEERAYIAGGMGVPAILGILGGILALLILLLIILLFVRRKKVVKEPLLPPEDDTRDNVYYYDEEGGGEEDQDYDLSQLHRGLDARPDVMRNDVVPTLAAAPQYRPRPANPDEIGNFIDENLKAADTDPTAPPYDSLLVFDYEGSASEAASLSSLNSSNSDVDQDYNCLNDWGPRFRKLADMYGGDEE